MADLYSQEILLKDEKAACSLHRCSVSVQKSANGQLSSDTAIHTVLGGFLLAGGIWYAIRVKELSEFYSLAIKYLSDPSTIDLLPFYMDPEVLSSEYHKWLGKACSVLALEAIQVSLLVVAARVIFKQPENTAN
ncbi:unnamed protein product [Allacma fusca]|uniref:Uncharacterized protein n=1 Tax=Allacma fusca TaxID=39272 RepID=A0A8J2P534_9HEXA|nr:unnamed protein product [Allacma fusca]